MANSYYWDLSVLTGSARTAQNWINATTGTKGKAPAKIDTAEIGSDGISNTVNLTIRAAVETLSLGGIGGMLPTLVIDAGGSPLAAGLSVGSLSDSFTIPSSGQAFTSGGTIALRNDGDLMVNGTTAAAITVAFDGTADVLAITGTTLASPNPGVFDAQVTGFDGDGEIVLNVPYDVADTFSYSAGVLSVFGPGGTELLDIRVNQPSHGFMLTAYSGFPGLSGHSHLAIASVPCFAQGTRILTARGEVTVETLVPGDLVVTRGDDGVAERPVRWIGRRRIDLSAHPAPLSVTPVRIARGALAKGVPARDLAVSPDHAIHFDGCLVPARLLLNGRSVVQEAGRREVEYFHIELDRHAILIAEGLEAESYLDTGNRGVFTNSDAPATLHPLFPSGAPEVYRALGACAPLAVDAATVEPIWRRIVDRAGGLVPAVDTVSDAALSLEVDGRIVRPIPVGSGRLAFPLPRRAATAKLVSRAGMPASLRPYLDDRRQLGVMISRLAIDGRTLSLDSPDLGAGWWASEPTGRWTDGAASIRLHAGAVLEVFVAATLDAYLAEVPNRIAA